MLLYKEFLSLAGLQKGALCLAMLKKEADEKPLRRGLKTLAAPDKALAQKAKGQEEKTLYFITLTLWRLS